VTATPSSRRQADEPDVSVIVLTINGQERLPVCLGALHNSGLAVQVVLVDNGSTDSTVDRARGSWPDVDVISNAVNEGFAGGCNQGAEVARGRYLLFLNDDALVGPSTLLELVRAADADAIGAVWQPPILSADGLRWDSAGSMFTGAGLLWHDAADLMVADAPRGDRRIFAAKGACLLVRRSSFEEVGGFDASFFAYYEETDLCWRLALRGHAIRLVAAAAPVLHVGGVTAGGLFDVTELDFMFFRNRLTSILTLPGPRTLASVLPLHLGAIGGLLLVALMTGHHARARGIWQAVLWVPRHRRLLSARRRRIQSTRLATDDEVFAGVTQAPPLRAVAAAAWGYLGNRSSAV